MRTLRFSLSVFLFAFFLLSLRAADFKFIAPNAVDWASLLPPPPDAGSAEQAADLATVGMANSHPSEADWALVKAQVDLNIDDFAPVLGSWFKIEALPKTAALFQTVGLEANPNVSAAKKHWLRKRPYQMDATIHPVAPEKSTSYPSGHSARGTVFAILLAEALPEKRAEILAWGRSIGWHRVIGGVHFPTDVYGGRVLGQAIAQAFLKNETFRAELAEVRQELLAAMNPKAAAQ